MEARWPSWYSGRVRIRTMLLPLLLSSSVALAACGGGGVKPATVGSRAGGAAPVSVEHPLALLPADSDLVVTIDVAALRRSSLFATYGHVVREAIVPGFAACDHDPFAELTTVTAGVPMSSTLAVFVVRGLDRARTLECLRTSTIETRTEAIFDGEDVLLQNQSGHANLLRFLDASNAVIQGSQGPTRQTLDQALTVGAPLGANPQLVAALARLRPGAVLSMVTVPGSPLIDERFGQQLGAPVHALAISLHVTDVVSMHLEVELLDAASAAAVAEGMRPQIAGLRQLVERHDLRTDGPRLLIDVTITEAQLKVFVDLVKTMAGGQTTGAAAPTLDAA